MACVNPDGSLSSTARTVLEALAAGTTDAQLAASLGLPMYRLRSSLRDLRGAGLVAADSDRHVLTDEGRQSLS
ncbi:MAG: hypothetical protein D6798_20240 [Deltaproteobacteria bacterium]|nr:MAG: hypothetical protein D6798_20240 [Deltaproteobacteria bacterium]